MNDDELHYIYKMIGAYGFCTVKSLLDKYNELDEANKKAIEYILNNSGLSMCISKNPFADYDVFYGKPRELLKILEGVEDE